MHATLLVLMEKLIAQYVVPDHGLSVLDCGSQDINGCLRPLFAKHNYVGVDQCAGKNVDVVSKSAYDFGLGAEAFDVITCCNVLEHCPEPHTLMKEMEWTLKKNGLIIITVPWQIRIHRYPIDCWRILPDGLEYLLTKTCKFQVLKIGIDVPPTEDCYAVGRRIKTQGEGWPSSEALG